MKHAYVDNSGTSSSEELQKMIEQIGIARFVGRINSGLIPRESGYDAVKQFIAYAKERPLLSRLTRSVLRRTDTTDTHIHH